MYISERLVDVTISRVEACIQVVGVPFPSLETEVVLKMEYERESLGCCLGTQLMRYHYGDI